MKKYLIIALAVINLTAYSQICESSLYPISNDVKLSAIPKKTVGNIDMLAVAKEDNTDNMGKVPRFGYPFEVDFNLNNSGNWTTLDNGDRLWLLSIECPQAKSINLLYDKYWLPEGATLHIYNKNKSQTIGAFTSKNNRGTYQKPKGFATGLVAGSSITLEYYEPKKAKNKGVISISTVVHGYKRINFLRPFYKDKKGAFGNSGNCNVNVNCPEGSNWQDEKTSVALIVVDGGTRWCTGSLVNNTSQDGKLYFLTAHHCLRGLDAVTNPNASDWMFYWNYESKNCSNNNDFTPPSTSGARLVANNSESDFALFELTESPYDLNSSLKSYFNGWDRENTSAIKVTGIHHPSGDIKKICVENDQVTSTKHGETRIRSNGTHWRVADWDVGVTEGGSSGSPLFRVCL